MPQLRRTRLTWLIYIQLGLYAYFLYGFGPVVGFLREEQQTSNALASLHSTALAVGAIVGGAVFPHLSRKFGRGRVMWASLAGVAVAVLAFVTLPATYPVTLALTAVIAFGGICVISGVVTSLSQLHGSASPAAISEANALAVGAGLAAPLIIGWSVQSGFGWRAGVGVLAGLIALVALVAHLLRIEPIPDERSVPASVHAGPVAALSGDPALAASAVVPEPAAGGAQTAGGKARQALPVAYWLAWTMMVMTGAVEIVLSLWTADVLREEISFTPAGASAAVSAILLGMLVGRAAGARVALRLRPMPLYFAALGLSLLGFVVFWLATSPGPAVAGLIIVGLGNAMHYPLAIAVALAVAPGQADRAAGVASYGMGLSFGVGPLMLGLLADEVGAHAALLLVPVFLAGAAALAWRLSRSAESPKLGDGPAEIVEQMA